MAREGDTWGNKGFEKLLCVPRNLEDYMYDQDWMHAQEISNFFTQKQRVTPPRETLPRVTPKGPSPRAMTEGRGIDPTDTGDPQKLNSRNMPSV